MNAKANGNRKQAIPYGAQRALMAYQSWCCGAALAAAAVLIICLAMPASAMRGPRMDMSVRSGALDASFDFHGPVRTNTFSVPAPDRLVIDVSQAALTFEPEPYACNTARVKRVRVNQHSYNPDVVRIVFDLQYATDLDIRIDDARGSIHVTESTRPAEVYTGGGAPQIYQPQVYEPQAAPFPSVSAVDYGDWAEVLIPFPSPAAFTSGTAPDPPRTYFDFAGYAPDSPKQYIPVNAAGLQAVRIAHYSAAPHTTRVVLDHAYGARVDTSLSAQGLIIRVHAPRGAGDAYPGVEQGPVSSLGGFTICVDAGHGGKDPGAVAADGTYEKTVNLDIALQLRDLLRQAGVRVVMTRDSDYFVPLDERAEIANRAGADLFVSIHNNAVGDASRRNMVRGTQTYYNEYQKFGNTVQFELAGLLRIGDSGTYSRGFAVLRRTAMPAVLVEVGFLTNPHDLALLRDATFRANAARGIFNGVARHLGAPARLAALPLSQSAVAHLPGGGAHRSAGAVASAGNAVPGAAQLKAHGFEQAHYEDDTTLADIAGLVQNAALSPCEVNRLKRVLDGDVSAADVVDIAGMLLK
jgi:N-acetylmuramoyl-L-alanine amidase